MQKQLQTSIKNFSLFIFIISLFLLAPQVNAQESVENKEKIYKSVHARYVEFTISGGYVSQFNPDLWNNNQYYSLGMRFSYQADDGPIGFTNFEFGGTSSAVSSIDGLTRQSSYQKLGIGRIFNKNSAESGFFAEAEIGLIAVHHTVTGEAAWRAPESDEVYEHQVIYENSGESLLYGAGTYARVAFGVNIKKRHRLSFYIQPIEEYYLTARSAPKIIEKHQGDLEEPYYYGTIPHSITNNIVGIQYGFVYPSPWTRFSVEHRSLPPDYDK